MSNKLIQIERTPNFSTILDKKDHCNSAQSWVFSTRLDVVAKRFINRNCKVVLGNPNLTHYSFSTKRNLQIQNCTYSGIWYVCISKLDIVTRKINSDKSHRMITFKESIYSQFCFQNACLKGSILQKIIHFKKQYCAWTLDTYPSLWIFFLFFVAFSECMNFMVNSLYSSFFCNQFNMKCHSFKHIFVQ